jgi:tRNA G18 (ribose-2'-O)-methylase SpoU
VRHEAGGDLRTIEESQKQERFPFFGVLDNIRSAHNVGSMFRTSDGANAAGLLLCGYSPTPPHRHLSKTALGAVETVPWEHYETTEEALIAVRSKGCTVLALEFTDESVPLYEFPLTFPLALLMGNETNGLSLEARRLCDATVHLPMLGHKSSLNVSVAYGVALYEILRRYQLLTASSSSS